LTEATYLRDEATEPVLSSEYKVLGRYVTSHYKKATARSIDPSIHPTFLKSLFLT